MRRNILCSMAFGLLSAASAWAGPNTAGRPAQFVGQINEQVYQIQAQADDLETFLRSGAHGYSTAAAYALEMADGTQKLTALLNQIVAQPGTTNDTRRQVDKIRIDIAELTAFVGNAFHSLDPHAMALQANDALASTAAIMDRLSMIRVATQGLAGTN